MSVLKVCSRCAVVLTTWTQGRADGSGASRVMHVPVRDAAGRVVAVLGLEALPTSPKSAFTKFDFENVEETAEVARQALGGKPRTRGD